MSRNGDGREGAGGADEDVQPAVALDHLRDERVRTLDLREVGRVRRGRVAEPCDGGFELAVGQVDARNARSGRDERLGAGEADAALRARDERDTRRPLRRSRERDHGVDLDRHVERQVRDADRRPRREPLRRRRGRATRSEKPLITVACSVKPSTALTKPLIFSQHATTSRPPSSRSIVPSTLRAVSCAAATPSSTVSSRADLAELRAPALAVRRAVPGDVRDVAVPHEPPVGQPHAGRDHLRRRDLEAALRQQLCDASRSRRTATLTIL